jgi:hypothetical protein
MPTQHPHHEVERRFRALMSEAGLPEPDAVSHEPDALVCLWHGPKVAVVVELGTDLMHAHALALDGLTRGGAAGSTGAEPPPRRRALSGVPRRPV